MNKIEIAKNSINAFKRLVQVMGELEEPNETTVMLEAPNLYVNKIKIKEAIDSKLSKLKEYACMNDLGYVGIVVSEIEDLLKELE